MNSSPDIACAERADLSYAGNVKDALNNADALNIDTEWKASRNPDFGAVKSHLKQPIIFDGRNLFEPANIKALGFEYYGNRQEIPEGID